MEPILRCNGCSNPHEPGTQAVASTCKHFFCMKCAQALLSKDEQCPMCDSMLSKSCMKAVNPLQEYPQGQLELMLCGQTPATIVAVAQSAIAFFMEQQRLNVDFDRQHSQQRTLRLQQQCKAKLEEVHNGYKQAKRKYQEAAQARNAVEQDNQELQQKYSQKAMQYRKVVEMYKQLQQENAELKRRQQQGMGGGGGGMGGGGQQMGQFGGPRTGAPQMVTTVQHQRSIIELSPQSGSGNMFLHGHGSATVGGGGQMRVQRPPAGGIGGGNGGFGNMFGGGSSPGLGGMLVPGNMQQQRRPGTSGGMFAAGNRTAGGGSGGGGGRRGLGSSPGLMGSPGQGMMSM